MNTTDTTLAELGEAPLVTAPGKPSTHYSPGATSSIEDRALVLLGSGISAEATALTLGVSAGRISQLLADTRFADKVSGIRFENAQAHNKRDATYDEVEDTLISKLKSSLPLIHKPETILKAITVINGAKRRGQSSPDQVTNQQTVVNVLLPDVIAAKFTVNVNNQVTRAGEQDLLTMPSGNLLDRVQEKTKEREYEHSQHQLEKPPTS